MASVETNAPSSAPNEPAEDAGSEFASAHAHLRRAVMEAIARRAGKSLQAISLQEAYSDEPLAELYYRKLHAHRFAEVVERFVSRWWKTQ
jgi:hypothetical protein